MRNSKYIFLYLLLITLKIEGLNGVETFAFNGSGI